MHSVSYILSPRSYSKFFVLAKQFYLLLFNFITIKSNELTLIFLYFFLTNGNRDDTNETQKKTLNIRVNLLVITRAAGKVLEKKKVIPLTHTGFQCYSMAYID